MKRGRILGIIMVTLSVLAVGACKKKPPATSDVNANTVAPPAAKTDVNSAPRPATNDTQAYDPLSDPDIAKLNEYLRSQGLLGDVYFDYDRAELREDARERLTRNAEWLRSHTQFEVTIEGHCDERGTNE